MQKLDSWQYISMKFQWRMLLLISIFFLLFVPFPQKALSETWNYDLGFVDHQDIWLSSPTLIVGKTVRIYARVHNFGKRDASGFVSFFQGNTLIGYSQPVSIIASSVSDEVFLDFTAPSGTFNILVRVEGVEPLDENGSNNQILTQVFLPQYDNDNDGIGDDDDNDDDNDGVEDDGEKAQGTDPALPDTDGDGVDDSDDSFPLDPQKGKPEEVLLPKTEDKEEIAAQQEEAKSAESSSVMESPVAKKTATFLAEDATEEVASIEDIVTLSSAAFLEWGMEDTAPKPTSLEKEAVSTESLPPLPDIYIIVKRRDWNTYVFRTNIVETAPYQFFWSFSDNRPPVRQSIAEHTFPWIGEYTVSVSVKNDQGEVVASQATSVPISFFHLDNIWIWGFVGILILIINLCARFWRRLGKEEDEVVSIRKKGKDGVATPVSDPVEKKGSREDTLESDLDWFIDDD